MTLLFEQVNTLLNQIHEWGEFDQHPMKRLFLTRVGTIATLFLETAAAGYALARVGNALFQTSKTLISLGIHRLFPKVEPPHGAAESLILLKKECLACCQRIAGLLSTLFLGIFSPEINFRNHKKLLLAIDNLSEKKEKELRRKLETELKSAQIKKERLIHFTQQQAEREKAHAAEEKEKQIDARLAELLLGIV
jgi:hypothetical protein